jgi:hypothetical protein
MQQPPTCCNHEEKKKEEEDLKKEKRVIKMVVLNGIINFVLRAPDVLFCLVNQNIWSNLVKSQIYFIDHYSPGLLSLILDIGYLTYILTFTTNFFHFLLFQFEIQGCGVFFYFKAKKSNFLILS